jgi:uncharacterized membrane protein YbaN (DUF454 family)
MFARTKRQMIHLWDARPGKRFQNYYRRTHRDKTNREIGVRIARLALAVVLFGVAVCLFIFPLIYVPFFVGSAAMLASESPRFARILDRSEEWSRECWAKVQERYGKSANVAVWALSFGCVALVARLCYARFAR